MFVMMDTYKFYWRFVLIFFSFSLSAIAAQDIGYHYEKALQTFHEGEYEATYIHLKNTLQANENHVPSKILLGRLYVQKKYFLDAEMELVEALELGGDIEFILAPLGKALLAQKEFERVIELGAKKRLSNQVKQQWYLLIARAYAGLKDPQQEFAFYQRAYQLNPNNIESVNSLAAYYIKQANYAQAQALLDESFKLDTNTAQTWQLQGVIYRQNKQTDKAFEVFNKALAIDAKYSDALRSLATLYFDTGDKKNTLLTVEQVLKMSPNDSRANLLKAHVLLSENQSALAKQVLEELNQRLSLITDESLIDNDWVYFIRATSAYLLGKYETAIREMKPFLNRHRENFHAVAIIADSYLKLDLKNKAKILLDEYRKLVVTRTNYVVILCDLYIENSERSRCDDLLDNLSEQQQASVDIVLVKARLAYSRENISLAIELVEAANKKESALVLESYLVNLYLANNQDQKAALLIANLLQEHPDNVNLLNAMSATFIKLGKPREAYAMAQQILTKIPNHFAARYHQAVALYSNKQPTEAKAVIEELLDQQPHNIKSLMLLSRIEAAQGHVDEAILQLTRLLDLEPYNLEATQFLVQLYRLTGQYEQALSRLDRLTRRYRLDTSVLQQKAEIFILLGERQNAINKLNVLFGFWRDDLANLISLANLQMRAKDYTGAQKSLDRAHKLDPKSDQVKYVQAKLALYTQDFSTAEKQLASLAKNHQDDSQLKALAGDTAIKQKQFEKAQLLYLQAFQLDMTNGVALVKAYHLALRGVAKESFEQHVIQGLDKYPSNFHYRNLLADYLLLNKRYGEAKMHYLRIVNLEPLPNRADVLNNLAYISLNDDLDAALSFAQKANQLKPNSAPILDTLGWALAKKSQFEQALAALRQAHIIDSQDPAIRYHLGFTLHQLGRTSEAISELKFAVGAPQAFNEKEEAQKLLLSLQSAKSAA